MSDEQAIPPRPWAVNLEGQGEAEQVWSISDANGRKVIITDCGYYPPNKPTAQLIVDAVNAYVVPEPRPK